MNPEHNHWEDERMAALFASADRSAVPPDEEFLARLGERTAEVFARPAPRPEAPPRRRRMIVLALRAMAASTAAAVLAVAYFWSALFPGDSQAFGNVLEKTTAADTLHLKITRDNKTSEIWVQNPGKLRWDEGQGIYRIARGGDLWLVDEKANRAARKTTDYFGDEGKTLDLLALLDLPKPKDRQAVFAKGPDREEERGGVKCLFYVVSLPTPRGPVQLEAEVDAGTKLLRSLEVTEDRDGREVRLAMLTVLDVEKPVDEDLFLVGDTLTEDGRIGKVTDVQGVVSVKPVMHQRWTPVAGQVLLKPGDWLRTDARGANAVAVRLVKDTQVTLGPGSLAEMVGPKEMRLFTGELKIVPEPAAPITLVLPGDQRVEVKGKKLFRLDGEKLVELKEDPIWLAGFEGTTTNESIGSLVAKVDNRDVELTVGYHKVTVDVRDQIARTVIEESFVNPNPVQLEGTFFFPLPQDASISGFGMWIGDEYVEADVVEKQRAREIYEQILREKRDPGLLEWSGGNIFKARVFPIPARGEKRIKITYTQVLPLRGNRFRYSYPLKSEMLKKTPLRELAIDVKIHSEAPLAEVQSPTHTVRSDRTKNSAHVEFTAQEYTPTRDFEVVVQLAGQTPEVVMIPHRRGDDGYFMLQLMPPDGADAWQRHIVADGEPVELLILADTSASMDADARGAQTDLIASLLGSLTPKDRFNLAGCDIDCQWLFDRAVPVEEKNADAAREYLADRHSLGWTDLDKAFASVKKHIGPKSQVIYVGDGIVTGQDSDPAAFCKRLRLLFAEAKAPLHAVTVGNSFEPVVMKTIASLGGGSVRRVGGECTPQSVALELLDEITNPGLRDLEVSFRGLRVARVYPGQLPNLPAGSQQILLGRYLPEAQGQQGEVIVTGRRGDEPVQFAAKVRLPDADAGNSFIPRLWARMHLDFLLEQGAASAIRDEIIALSEEYHIITPYTSLLVLESDEDRERFGVKRRFQMRDGEKFFQEGRDEANYELVQQQMRRAGNWRLGLRRAVLQQLVTLGRNPRAFQDNRVFAGYEITTDKEMYLGTRVYAASGAPIALWDESGEEWQLGLQLGPSRGVGLKRLGEDSRGDGEWSGEWFAREGRLDAMDLGGGVSGYSMASDGDRLLRLVDRSESMPMGDFELGLEEEFARFEPDMPPVLAGERLSQIMPSSRPMGEEPTLFAGTFAATAKMPMYESTSGLAVSYDGRASRDRLLVPALRLTETRGFLNKRIDERYAQTDWLDTLFPGLPGSPTEAKPEPPEKPWPAEARELARKLLRTDVLAGLKGGLQIDIQTDGFETRFNKLTSRSRWLALVSPTAWLTHSQGSASQGLVAFCDRRERGVFSTAFQLGRLRKSTPMDLKRPPLNLHGPVLTPLDETYRDWSAELKPQDDGKAMLVLTNNRNEASQIRFLVETQRNVVLKIEYVRDGKVTSSTVFGDFIEVAGAWWAGSVETLDAQGRRTSLATQQFRELDKATLEKRIAEELAPRADVQFLAEPGRTVLDAKKALDDGKADFDDQMTLLLHFARSQQWDRVLEHLERAEELAKGKPGMRWVRDAVLNSSRRREELRQRIFDRAADLVGHVFNVPAVGHVSNVPDSPKKPARWNRAPRDADRYFLANYLFNQARSIFGANEMLRLLDEIKPIIDRQPPQVQAVKQWKQNRIGYLNNVGRGDEALALQKELATDYPADADLQRDYANALANIGEYRAAYAWLDRALAADFEWYPHEETSLRNTYAQLLRNQKRYDRLVEFLADWIDRKPESDSPYEQYLTALLRSGRMKQAEELVARWLEAGRVPDPQGAVYARLHAAIQYALGGGYNRHVDRIDERWLEPLAEAALYFARNHGRIYLANQTMGNWRFNHTDACRDVRRKVAAMLVSEIANLEVVQIQNFIGWIMTEDPAVEPKTWDRITAGLKGRWQAEKDLPKRQQLAESLLNVLRHRGKTDEVLAFLRERLQRRPSLAVYQQLFNELLSRPWSQEYEDEAFSLLEKQSYEADPKLRLGMEVAALHRLTDAMIQRRHKALMDKIADPEKLTRTERREKDAENLRKAREQFADRLHAEAKKHDKPLAQWIDVERMYLDVVLGRNLDQVAEQCWKFLGPKPPEPREVKPEEVNDVLPGLLLDQMLWSRHIVTLANLASRRNAAQAMRKRLLDYVDAGIEVDAKAVGWKLFKYELLVAWDQPEALEAALRRWTEGEDPDNRWRRALGYLMAEQGKLAEAIGLFEAIEADDELLPADYRALADWYMVVDRRQDYERAIVESYKTTQEYHLQRWLQSRLRPWQQTDVAMPEALDDHVPLVFKAVFAKSSQPQNHLYLLREFYGATKDFRLLAGLADSVVGHTAGRVYPFLSGMAGVLEEIREEATVDQIAEHLAEVRKTAKTEVDRRALDLLEMLVERRAAELINQPGPHAQKALAAMQRAFKREWSPGEQRLVADLLASLGRIAEPTLAAEQLRELEVLHLNQPVASDDRLHVGHRRAQALAAYSRYVEAVDLLQNELDAYRDKHGPVLPDHALNVLETMVGFLENQRHYARGEQVLLDQLAHPANRQQQNRMVLRLYSLYTGAIRHDGTVSLGHGQTLYEAVVRKIERDLDTEDQNHGYNLVQRLCDVFRTAHNKKLEGVAGDVREFAFKQMPDVLERLANVHQALVGTVADTVHSLAGARDGLVFVIERIEQEPAWLRYDNSDGWSQHAWRLGEWRKQVGDIGDLEPRLLKIVLAEIRSDLESQRSRNRSMYDNDSSHFWKAKAPDFLRTAEAVYAERKGSGAAVKYIAEYLYHDLDRHDRAIEMLLAAYREGILDENGQRRLVEFLHWQGRYGESIAILEPLVERRPDDIWYRVRLMHAYFQTKQQDALLDMLAKTEAHFRTGGRWTESNIAQLAYSCLENKLFERSVEFYEKVIKLHQDTHPRRGVGDGTLSGYYYHQADAYSGLKQTDKAVEAACAAIVSWGPRREQRQEALDRLKGVLRRADDLDAYVARLDAEAEKTHQDKPVVRRALGQVYFNKKEYDKAAVQLKLAAELQPGDTETYELLRKCYDELEDPRGAIGQLLQAVQVARREIKLFEQIGDRYGKLDEPHQAERAYTSIVEMLPNESESHALLAAIRQNQNRWEEAVTHWQRVAEIRSLEPTGLLKLAEAQIHLKRWDDAAETIRRLRAKSWPPRFHDAETQIRNLDRKLPQ